MDDKNLIAIEIGSSKVKGAIGTYSSVSGVLTVQAVEEEPLLDWVRYGAVSNVEELSKLVNRIIRKIENRVSPRKVSTVYVSIGGRSLSSTPRDVERRMTDDVEITDDILSAMRHEVSMSPYPDRDLLAVVPKEYYVNKVRVEQPKGTVGRHIKMSVNLITCRQSTRRNLDLLLNDKLKIGVGGYEVRQLALGEVVLNSEERHLGCVLVDFGAETTTVSIYRGGCLQYVATVPMGSRNITRDLMKLNILEEQAEYQKRTMGNASGITAAHGIGSYADNATLINNYVRARAGEIIANIRSQFKYAGLQPVDLPSGIVIVGRGALLAGFNDALSAATGMKVRVGSVGSDARIRISDARISPTDASDVISVMFMAARRGAVECLKDSVTELPKPEPAPKPIEKEMELRQEPEPEPEPEPAASKPRRRGFLERLKVKVANLVVEDPDENDDDFKDD